MNRHLLPSGLPVALLSFLACSVAFSDELPHRRAGLWESTVNMTAQSGHDFKTQQCVDEKTDAAMQRRAFEGNGAAKCERTDLKKVAGGFETSSVCQTRMGTITSHVRMTGDMQSAYRAEVSSHHEPAGVGPTDTHTVIDAKWLGACPADMQAGDIRVNGMIMHTGAMPGATPGAMSGAAPAGGAMGGFDPKVLGSMSPAERMEYMKKLMEARQQTQ